MENEVPALQAPDGRSSRRDRLMGKLFGGKNVDRKLMNEQKSAANVDAFLHSSSDNLTVTHAPPPPPPSSLPKLAKLDTSISRYPQALAVNQQAQQNRPLAPGPPRADPNAQIRSPRPNKKGHYVKFTEAPPDVIGEGGDESEIPVIDVAKRKKTRPPQPPPHRQATYPPGRPAPPSAETASPSQDDFKPRPLSRTQTGFSSIYEPVSDEEPQISPPGSRIDELNSAGSGTSFVLPKPRFIGQAARDEVRRSYIEIHSAEMREQEGRAFAEAARVASATSATSHNWDDPLSASTMSAPSPTKLRRQIPSPEASSAKQNVDHSPASADSNSSSIYSPATEPEQLSRKTSIASHVSQPSLGSARPRDSPRDIIYPMSARSASIRVTDTVSAEEALGAFVARTKHLFELFRLHAESVKPLGSCTLKECSRGALWWFLKGRLGLESAVRERPKSPQGQMQNDRERQQAYSNLAKGYWLSEEVIPEIAQTQGLPPETDIVEVSQALINALKKLAMSMKRNGFLPPEEPFLPQTIDKSIWLEYPALSQDMVALLSGNWGAGMTAMTNPLSNLRVLDALPTGDNADNFSYGRVPADVYLMEQGHESQKLYFPCMLSMVRPLKSLSLTFILASQNGHIQLAIQENKTVGPIWEDVRWRNETCSIDVKLRRGFCITIQLVQQDYRLLWNMYDFGTKIQTSLFPRSDENMVFKTTLRSFQYMDADPQSRQFPKEPVAQCDVALFEKQFKENSPSGVRLWHLGFRIAVVTGPRTRTLSGVSHVYTPSQPIQFGFFRGDKDAPSLSIKYDNGKSKGRMVFIFAEEKARIKFHSLITGTAMEHDEKIYADVPIKNFGVSQSLREPLGMAPFSRMPWKAARVVNDEYGDDIPPTVLADRLKIVLEYQNGNVTDRVNVAPGELRVRLEVSNAKMFRVLRQPQKDITLSVSEAQVPKELPRNMADALQLLRHNQTIRSFEFNNIKDLHDFQFAMTGFEVIFDALAVTFAISRRRMVVPIHKKWEAGYTRIQVVRQEDKLQLLAFFEDFHHGHCMNFVLKGTDIYESFQRGSKSGIKFVDAKFPLPKVPADKDADYDEMAFVCLDLPDLPGEHDDLTIMFEKESDRDALSQVLPAPAKGSSKTSSRLK